MDYMEHQVESPRHIALWAILDKYKSSNRKTYSCMRKLHASNGVWTGIGSSEYYQAPMIKTTKNENVKEQNKVIKTRSTRKTP
jgi:hypothetical protein